jgi:hypothetical protein
VSQDGERITEFALKGGSFNLSGLPSDHVQELINYRRLFMAMAETLWKRDHHSRKLRPEFRELVRLSFVLGEGSTTVEVVHHIPPGQQLPLVSLVAETVERMNRTFEGIVAGAFPEDLETREFAALEKIGATLRPGQEFEFRHGTTRPINYDVAKRESFINEMDRRAVQSTVLGTVVALNVNLSFAIKPLGGGAQISGRFSDRRNFDHFKSALSVEGGQLVWIDCDLLVDPRSRKPRSVREVHDIGHFPAVHPEDLPDVLRLSSLQDGWFEGAGHRVEPQVLRTTAEALGMVRTRQIPRPQVAAEPDGPITLQWADYPMGTVLYVEEANTFSLIQTNVETGETLHRSDVTGLAAALDALEGLGPK